MGTVIKVDGLTKHFGDCLAVDHISFEVAQGEILGFLGPNGAGKTTTQRMLTGVLAPTSGDAYLLDHDVSRDPVGAKEHIGVVPEVANPYLELSGRRNLMLMGELCGVQGGGVGGAGRERDAGGGAGQARRTRRPVLHRRAHGAPRVALSD